MLTDIEKEGVLRLASALKVYMSYSFELQALSHYLRYVPDELKRDVDALDKLVNDTLRRRDDEEV